MLEVGSGWCCFNDFFFVSPLVSASSDTVGDGEMREMANAGHIAQTDARVARSRLNAQLVVQITAVTTVSNHVDFICYTQKKRDWID